jgi:uncharacterized protein (DUF2237 family)
MLVELRVDKKERIAVHFVCTATFPPRSPPLYPGDRWCKRGTIRAALWFGIAPEASLFVGCRRRLGLKNRRGINWEAMPGADSTQARAPRRVSCP